MLSGTFLFFVTVAIVCYGIQGSLQTTFARRYDAFATAVYRNLSLVITMAPVLLLVPTADVLEITEHVGLLFLASGTGAISMLLSLSSSRYLPIGVATAIRQVIHVFAAIALGVLFLNEWLTFFQFVLLITIMFIGIALALSRADFPHLDPKMLWRGLGLTAAAGFAVACSFFFFSILSREVHPIVAGYFWEAVIGLFAVLYFLVWSRWGMHGGSLRIPASEALKIAGIALLTIPATVCYAFALSMGPYAIASGLLTMTTLVAVVMGWVLYKEHLSRSQVVFIIIAVGLMFLMKVS